MVAFRAKEITVLPFRIADLGPSEDLPKNSPMQRKLADAQESSPPRSRTIHPKEQGVRQKCQEAYRDEKGDPGKTQTQEVYKRNIYKKQEQCTFYLVNSVVVEIAAIPQKETDVDYYCKHYQTWSVLQIKTESSGKEIQHWTSFKIILNFTGKEGETDPGTPKPKSSYDKKPKLQP
ncbi:hypothetical protein WISP_20375 [Willisornis vidua]|uniref:Uncharacterized protein n=1 Tax=Willisornis vidua TaxID=1566151 RepID=A0ABQ9DRA1_9PASS|nr:hypothetical protein WISP_20375 [Willisornis vidua]